VYEELLSSPLEVRVLDRSPAPQNEAPLFPPPPPPETAQVRHRQILHSRKSLLRLVPASLIPFVFLARKLPPCQFVQSVDR
jgi:hypothetical protein